MELEGRAFETNMFIIEMKDFDIILDTDWLGYNNATMRCREKEMSCKTPRNEEFFFLQIKDQT